MISAASRPFRLKDAVKEIEDLVRRHGFVCQYTGKKLNLTDHKDPFYFSFDHMIPGDGRTLKLTFALLNEMKSDMTFQEFEYYILQFSKFFTTGKTIIKKKLKYWFRATQEITVPVFISPAVMH